MKRREGFVEEVWCRSTRSATIVRTEVVRERRRVVLYNIALPVSKVKIELSFTTLNLN